MCDLLSRPLARLRGHPLEAMLEVLDQFDLTLSDNTSIIQASINKIELIAAQTLLSDPNLIGESSRRNNCGDEDDFVDAHTGCTKCNEGPKYCLQTSHQ
ncbi:hypothetical protein PAHAL_2G400200 [Panicum hallii]|uniref:Uncharacterized protein n=1 Tax=Panicum hallii TaxID=206008 RepID=A0A2S3H1M0_9POAL|nr:hypothetical protein PAHAL_2G400200 [Panicum hallii]